MSNITHLIRNYSKVHDSLERVSGQTDREDRHMHHKSSFKSRVGRTAAMLSLTAAIALSAGVGLYPQATATAAAMATTIAVDGNAVTWSVEPQMRKGTTFVPLRETAELLGAAVRWNTAERVTELKLHGDTILHRPGTAEFLVNAYPVQASLPSFQKDGTTMVPLRTLAEVLKADLSTISLSGHTAINLTLDAETVVSGETGQADQYLIDQQYSGIALIAKDGQILLRKGYGYSDENRLVHAGQKSRIASLTKSFTAAAVMKLEEEDRLKLDDTLESYIPGFPSGDRITLHMLLSHTSGLSANIPREPGMTLQQTIDAVKAKPLEFEPGTDFKYSNIGYVLLASIIEQASGMEYGAYLQQNFFQPLSMKETGEADLSTPVIKGYVRQDNGWTLAEDYISQSGTGSLYSTVDDLLKWDAALNTDEVLQTASLEKMFTPYSAKNYGYGWMIKQQGDHTIVFHNGSGTGYATGLSREAGGGVTIILLGNHAGIDMLELMESLRGLVE
ncbi:hypothetical protein EHV15_22170 [Paenibacillus oralis]|uniref:Class A beta-lactamase-related serine hydrolase n=1 Tax=Paenibacillus oralis TaxID=2490856 RepID=A0A3P3UA40_9BACL|nr:serine hydrolase [Paenibacillus oralis]RRJ65313.1 hypothetical protein EHV15_22170 [Paenibacillus oralis]